MKSTTNIYFESKTKLHPVSKTPLKMESLFAFMNFLKVNIKCIQQFQEAVISRGSSSSTFIYLFVYLLLYTLHLEDGDYPCIFVIDCFFFCFKTFKTDVDFPHVIMIFFNALIFIS